MIYTQECTSARYMYVENRCHKKVDWGVPAVVRREQQCMVMHVNDVLQDPFWTNRCECTSPLHKTSCNVIYSANKMPYRVYKLGCV